jgi:hypothetical protein
MKRIPALGEEVKRVHVGRPDDAEHVGHALCDQRFDKGFGRRHARLALGDTTVDFRRRVRGAWRSERVSSS